MVNLGSALLKQCSCDVCVCECEVVRDLQDAQDVVLKLSYRSSRSGMTKQGELSEGVGEKELY